MQIDRERLSKLMMMTTSSHDGEVVVAVRKANALLSAAGFNWQQLLGAPTAPPRRQPPPPPPSQRPGAKRTRVYDDTDDMLTNEVLINSMLNVLLERVSPHSGFYQFVERMRGVFERKGRLTKGQFDALRRAMPKEQL